jgi:hypothetical protein
VEKVTTTGLPSGTNMSFRLEEFKEVSILELSGNTLNWRNTEVGEGNLWIIL